LRGDPARGDAAEPLNCDRTRAASPRNIAAALSARTLVMPRSPVSPPPVTLAKFSRPRLYDVLRRERLFERLDAARAHPIVFIAGPPGAGKSTLIASYIEARKAPGVWFQTDAGDADPGTFFHYLTLAAAELLRTRTKRLAALPRFGPEYATELPHFTRRFLRAFFALFPQRSILVIDNFHEAPATAAWRHAFSEGLRELPAGLTLVFASRMPPPPEMARLIADQSLVQIDWSELRFTTDEATAMTAGAGVAPSVARDIHRASDGWAAGIVLMREHLARAGALDTSARVPDSKEAVFAYFTGEIFERARPNNRRTLLLAALLPSVTGSDAAAITGDEDAPRVLDYLYRQHLFTDRRRGGAEPVYQFHALFREFLLEEGRKRLSVDERRDALDRAAGQLVSRGEFDAAAALYREAQAWPALTGLALHVGAALIAEGRANTLAQWIDALPEALRQREPRLALYLGVALLYSDPPRAKRLLDAAYDGFVANGDVRRILMTAAHAVDCHYFEWADFTPLDRWIAVFEKHLTPTAPLDSAYDAMRVYSAFLIALLFREPEHPRITGIAREVARQIADDSALDVPLNFRLDAASILFNYYNWKTKGDTADALIARVTPWLADPRATPLNRVWWRVHLAFNHQILGRFAHARRTMDEAEAIAREHGLRSFLFEIYYAEVTPVVASRDVAASVAALEKLRTVLNPARRMDVAYFRFQESTVRMLEGRTQEALRAAQEALALGREAGLPPMQVPHFLVREALCHLQQGAVDRALARYDEAIAASTGVDRSNFQVQRGLVDAHRARTHGDVDGAVAALRDLLPVCRARGYLGFLRQNPEVVAPLFALALEHGIEREYTQKLIRERQLAPPSPTIAHWPWPLALRTLGEFVVVRDGTPLVSKGKAQKRPLEMLKALIALGGRNVDASMLTAQLWPDAEGDDAKTSFDSGLYRLRKLLAVDGALALAEGRLSLNPGVVWLDVWAFEQALDATPPDVDAALACYRGHFLGLEAAAPWALPLRDRLQARLARAVLARGQALEASGDFAAARVLYERALELDNLAEAIYRRLMICQRELGDPTGALTTYRRCRELLSIVLGRKPAAETEAIRASLVTA
jgi:ATP/maltotriose-dependent transcriptional regulator MalT/DNA-binding SARP family transcriptional activator